MNANTEPQPICRHLRMKQMYVPSVAKGALEKHLRPHDDSFYTCNRTLTVLGCDDDAVHPRACCPSRGCYRA